MKNESTIAPSTRVASASNAGSQKRGVHRVLIALTAAALTLASSSSFAGWTRGGTAYTGRGEYSGAHVGSCNDGSCSHAGGIMNPWGRTATNAGTVTRTAPGQFSNSGTAYGPNGRQVQHAGNTSCADASCTHTGSATGPNGKTANTPDTVTRTAPSQYTSSGSVTGPNGSSSTHSASTNCAGYTCNRSGTVNTATAARSRIQATQRASRRAWSSHQARLRRRRATGRTARRWSAARR